MQNILILILVSNLLSGVKSFSIDYRYTNSYNTNNQIYSYYFNSNQLSYNHYSNYLNSNYFNSNALQSISSYKYNSFNNYLSIIKSIPSQSVANYYSISVPIATLGPTLAPTLAPVATLIPTLIPTLAPTLLPVATLAPTLLPVATLAPTLIPTKKQTEMPTIQEVASMSFDTKLTFDNYDSEELDIKSQQAIIIATANSMNVSETYVEYIGSTLKTRRLSIFRILGFNIIVTLKTTIPLQSQRDPSSLYADLTSNLINSVNSGLFTSYLMTASNTLGITSFANSSISSVQNDDYVIKEPYKPRIKENENETSYNYNIIYIIFGVLLSVYLLLYFVWLRKKYLNKNRQLRSLFSNMTNPTDITIRIVEN